MKHVRMPAVAGRFYPGLPAKLDAEVARMLDAAHAEPAPALAVVVPHAGYLYSGAIAAETFARVIVPRTAIVLCPNHTGQGARRALWASGAWRLPGGDLRVDEELAEELRDPAALQIDEAAHLLEHAVEVQLPLLRARNPEVRIVPICLAGMTALECQALGEAIASVVAPRGDTVLLVASTDMSHYTSADRARERDARALERIEAIDAAGLFTVVRDYDISMCGVIPTTVVLAAARALGARSATRVRYGNSGETSGAFDRVVGYAGFVIPRPA
jgi:AmmeMemoRadiSam system protein B